MSVVQIICIALFVAIVISTNAAYFLMRTRMKWYDIPMPITIFAMMADGAAFVCIMMGAIGAYS